MPKSKTCLPDVNVWLALASRRYIHAPICGAWLNSIEGGEVAFCRVTQMGLLRLLTNESVMGLNVLSSRDAWRAYRTMLADERVQFAPEPFALEEEWRITTSQDRPTPKIWTGAYLAAFARASGMQLVTLDRAVLSIAREALLLKWGCFGQSRPPGTTSRSRRRRGSPAASPKQNSLTHLPPSVGLLPESQ